MSEFNPAYETARRKVIVARNTPNYNAELAKFRVQYPKAVEPGWTSEPAKPVNRFGYEFKPMDERDWECFAGADEGTLICYPTKNLTLLLAPSGTLSELITTDDGDCTQTDWTPTNIIG